MSPRDLNLSLLAFAYRRLVLWFGVQLLLFPAWLVALPTQSPLLFAPLQLVGITTTIALAYYGYRTAQALDFSMSWIWGLAMFLPCFNLLTLLTLSFEATQICRIHGIQVGLLGPKIESD